MFAIINIEKLMLEEINKAKSRYDVKIAECEKMIDCQRESLRVAKRHDNKDSIDSLLVMINMEKIQRKAYIEAKYYFDDLIDQI